MGSFFTYRRHNSNVRVAVIIDWYEEFSVKDRDTPLRGDVLRRAVQSRVLPFVQTPAQYIGGELNAVDPRQVADLRGRVCMIFPDLYTIGISCHGLQVLYSILRRMPGWLCERAFAPWSDMEAKMREESLPWYSLESFTPLSEFDVLGITLQSELTFTSVLTILDLSAIPLDASERTLEAPLVVAGGPCSWNPEPLSRFIDLYSIGDGEEVLPQICEAWLQARSESATRSEALEKMAKLALPGVYVPSCYTVEYNETTGLASPPKPCAAGVPEVITPAVVRDLDAIPLPTSPVVPWVEAVQDRIAIEIMRGCPHRCRFCQSNPIRRPLRYRSIDNIVAAALESYHQTGYNEISLLSLSTSDYPHFSELMHRMQETFHPLDVAISVPSLRVNEQLAEIGDLVTNYRRSGLTLAPEAATDEMRRRIGKNITNEDLYTGCRRAFEAGFNRVKLYFMCGLPGETEADIEAIIELAETISRLGKEVSGRFPTVVVSCSNFIPKPHTPLQWVEMRTPDYFRDARWVLKNRNQYKSISVKTHDADGSCLEGLLAKGDRRMSAWIEAAWRAGARFESWTECFAPEIWWNLLDAYGIVPEKILHQTYPVDAPLPWDHIVIRQGREHLVREYENSLHD